MGGRSAQGSDAVGQAVASFPTYEAAQKAVSSLIAADIPARDIAIVGQGLRSIERITGRLGYASAARSGAVNGLLLGLLFSAILVIGSPSVPIQAFVGVLFVGIAIGMLLSIVTYSFVRRRRDYASVMQVVADHYEITVTDNSVHRARQVLGPQAPTAPAASAAASSRVASPAPAGPSTPAAHAATERGGAAEVRRAGRADPGCRSRSARLTPARLTPARLTPPFLAGRRLDPPRQIPSPIEPTRRSSRAARTATAHDRCRRFLADRRGAAQRERRRSRPTSWHRRRRGRSQPSRTAPAPGTGIRSSPVSPTPSHRRASRRCASTSRTSKPEDGCRDPRRTRSRRGRRSTPNWPRGPATRRSSRWASRTADAWRRWRRRRA